MGRGFCRRHGADKECTCSMGNMNKLLEPAVLLSLRQHGARHGYELASDLNKWQVTDTFVDKAAVYRSLRSLEEDGMVESVWEVMESGPARHMYTITKPGEERLLKWAKVLRSLGSSIVGMANQIEETSEEK